MICRFCCTAQSYDLKKIHCNNCNNDKLVVFHFTITLVEYSPIGIIQNASPELKLFISGKHAQELLQVTPEEYIEPNPYLSNKRKVVHEKLESLLHKFVTISVTRAREVDKNYGYQIVNSYFVPQPEMEK